ncbi:MULTISPECIES: Bug family tripartite tricarboxylate transporter substrate binding protein [Variovorax]|uniref:Tripartite tricarboxylate transporter substrate binding protein n=1 Tax=Variovorax ginsengisoli TaxID=363844 RepID=A0ABT8SCY1_9BURK|nr:MULTISPECIES: tripartite tricarboxylate transporter substrate binding protein [Variovorax]MDM0017615.1 tripartite tricarboxylate transporter substrate binding protein [Variovorax sp. J22R187]MDM0028756.1 tripartite tricarboxylate transporter substrate binding protein [Variovorax sp. J31P216]MDN8617602.1 tripartite tricarboxylate transporter substrate binding protein [Variovorax ginsengisoli]MDO1536772.1 tripartite tricarboxylate transporter substrate binding protein [Variovorax ginsengisoli]
MQVTRRLLATRALALTAGALTAAALPMGAFAQQFPTKAVRIITPFPVGGGPDGVARLVADKLSRAWGQPVVVENRPGGNGFIAIDAFKRGAKDGHDMIVLDNVHLAAYPALFKKLPYDPVKDFDTLLPLFKTYFFFTVATDSKYKTVGDIIADAKANPGKLNFGSWSIGNPVHLGSELFASTAGIKMEHVLYKETTQLYTSVSTGELAFALGSAATAGPLQRAGKLRFLAVTAPQRNAAFPDVPTVGESGGPKGFEVTGWNAIAVPPGLPPAVTDKIKKDIETALASPDVLEKFKSFGYEPFPQTRDQFNQFVKAETQRFGDVIRKANISLD